MTFLNKIRNKAHNFFNHEEINLIITTILIFTSMYIAVITLIGGNFLDPLAEHLETTTSSSNIDAARTIFVIFVLVLIGLFAARLAKALKIPPLFGCLVVGIAIRNVPVLEKFFVIAPFVETMIRKVALVNIVIRWGLATDVQFLYENAVMPVTIGLVTAIGEIVAVTVASYFILSTSLVMSVFCAFILVTVSPAVTVPAMISFKDRNLGSSKRLPDNILAICCVDNLFCVIAFMVFSSIIFNDAPIATTVLLNAGTIAVGILGGIVIGWVFWRFPRPDQSHTQFARIALLGATSISFMIGSYFRKYSCSGFIAALVLSAMCAMKWKNDNKNRIESVVSTYRYVWDSFDLPLLFICLGLKFDLSTLTRNIVFLCIVVIAIGLLVRTILIIIVTRWFHNSFKEQIVVALSLLPRATFQADLAPTLLVMAAPFPEMAEDASLVMKAAILSVLATAPIFDVLLNVLGPKLLRRHDAKDKEKQGEELLERLDEPPST